MKCVATFFPFRLVSWLVGLRFFKFGLVGVSGVIVNLSVLYLGQEFLFSSVISSPVRLNLALALAIACATLNNFCWNRGWTWADRRYQHSPSFMIQLGQYALGSWCAILIQFVLTQCFTALHLYYLLANLLAIFIASLFNFVLHHFWTFKSRNCR